MSPVRSRSPAPILQEFSEEPVLVRASLCSEPLEVSLNPISYRFGYRLYNEFRFGREHIVRHSTATPVYDNNLNEPQLGRLRG
jgi:hypothetical protein